MPESLLLRKRNNKTNGNELYIDFINESVHDSTYSFTVQNNTLTLVGGNDTAIPGKVYELTKQE